MNSTCFEYNVFNLLGALGGTRSFLQEPNASLPPSIVLCFVKLCLCYSGIGKGIGNMTGHDKHGKKDEGTYDMYTMVCAWGCTSRHAHTYTHRHADMQACRHADTQTRRLADMQT